jgi:hypothetical protein
VLYFIAGKVEMCNDLNEYDPFEPLIIIESDGEEYVDNEPMNSYDWDVFLETIGE